MIVRDVTLQVACTNLVGLLYLPDGEGPYPAVCVCHGIPAGVPDPNNKGYPLLAEKLCHEGLAVFIFNFRGTGASGGNIDLAGWVGDLQGVIDYLYGLPEVDTKRLFLLGFSGGAAVSVRVAAQDKRVSAVIACACPAEIGLFRDFENPQSIVAHFRNIGVIRDMDFPPSVEGWLNGFRLVKPIDYVSGISPRSLLLVHGDADETIPVSHARRLYERAGAPKQLIIVAGVGHRLRQDDRVTDIIIEQLNSLVRSG